MQNSAINLLRHIGGTAAAMVTMTEEQKAIQEFLRQDAIDNPVPPRVRPPKLFRQYQKRYGA